VVAARSRRRTATLPSDRRLGPEEIEPVLRRIAAALGSDTSVCDRPRILRAVGTTNHKRSEPERIEVVSFTGEIHDAGVLLRALPPDPGEVGAGAQRAGAGTQVVPKRRIAEGEGRHDYLVDMALRLVRAGVLDVGRIEAHLELEFELACEPLPPPRPGAIAAIARWAVGTRIAQREFTRPAPISWWARAPQQEVGNA
jgi:hypothetical protein